MPDRGSVFHQAEYRTAFTRDNNPWLSGGHRVVLPDAYLSIRHSVRGEALMSDNKYLDVVRSNEHLEMLEEKIITLSEAYFRLSRGSAMPDMLNIIHRPGWTTPAEYVFVTTVLNAIDAHVSAIERLQMELLSAARLVGEVRQAAS